MVYRIDLSPDRQHIMFWTGIGSSKSEASKNKPSEGYTLKAKLDDGFSIVGTRIEVVEKEIRENYQRHDGK